MASTPPPPSPSTLREPPAPRHGPRYDKYEAYPTRYSTRLESQRIARASQTTPPPSHPSTSAKSGTTKRGLSPASPRAVKPSPKKTAHNHASSSSSSSSSRIAPSDSHPSRPAISARQSSRSSAERALPTPVKTPSKKQAITSSSATSRALFPPSAASKRRKMEIDQLDEPRTRASQPFQVYSDHVPQAKSSPSVPSPADITIHTDTRDRIPVDSGSKDNIFHSKPGSTAAARRPATRSTTNREEGAWYVCRGKKVFQPFADIEDDEEEDETDLGLFANRPDLLAKNPDCLKGLKPLNRRDIKPKVLFRSPAPPVKSTFNFKGTDVPNDDEEDVTDVEDNEVVPPSPEQPSDTLDSQPESKLTLSEGSSLYSEPSFSQDLDHSSSNVRQRSSSSGGSLRDWLKPASKTRARQQETPAERVKRHRETRGSPYPRTRRAKLVEAAAALGSIDEGPATGI